MNHSDSKRDGYTISADPERMDVAAIHAYLSRSYWASGIPLATVRRSMDHSLCFGLFHQGEQVGFARLVTDKATFAYLADVYVLEEHRGQGLGLWLVETVLAHPEVQGVRRFMLVTRDAARLYSRFGFEKPSEPSGIMQIRRIDPYSAHREDGLQIMDDRTEAGVTTEKVT